jgi:hypothetical protein
MGKMNCKMCGKEIDDKTCFEYEDERGIIRAIPDLCTDKKCVDEYTDEYYDCEPNIDYEELWQKQQDDLWEEDVLWKEE